MAGSRLWDYGKRLLIGSFWWIWIFCIHASAQDIVLSADQVRVTKAFVMETAPQPTALQGTLTVTAESTPLSTLPLKIQCSLANKKGAVVKEWMVDESAAFKILLTNTAQVSLSLPFALGEHLPFDEYTLTAVFAVDTKRLNLPFGYSGKIDVNTADNKAVSPLTTILKSSNKINFGGVFADIVGINTFAAENGLIKIHGTAKWNELDVTIADLLVSLDAANEDLIAQQRQANFSPPEAGFQAASSSWKYRFSNGVLDANGAFADVSLVLPDGAAYKDIGVDKVSFSEEPLDLGRQPLLQDGNLFQTIVNINRPLIWMSEEMGYTVEAHSHEFNASTGLRLLNPRAAYRFEEHVDNPYPPRFTAVSDGYYQGGFRTDGDVILRADGFQCAALFFANSYSTAFPMKGGVRYDNFTLKYRQGKIDGANALPNLRLSMSVYASDCGSLECADSPAADKTPHGITFERPGYMYRDGSIIAEGPIVDDWKPAFNTYTFSKPKSVSAYYPGFIVQEHEGDSGGDAPANSLLTSRNPQQNRFYDPYSPDNMAGRGLFAGYNLMSETLAGESFKVLIGGEPLELSHSPHSKFYIRPGGYTGLVDTDGLNKSLEISRDPACNNAGYKVNLTSFAQAYLDNSSDGYESLIDGSLFIDWPAFITVPFEGMRLTACGEFGEGRIPPEAQAAEQTLAYWLAELRLTGLEFLPRDAAAAAADPCAADQSPRTLWLTTVNTIPQLSDKPMMRINLKPCGLVGDSFAADYPAASTYEGFDAGVARIYLSQWDGSPAPQAHGFYSIVGDLHMATFDNLRFQGMARGSQNWMASGTPWRDADEPDANRDGFADSFNLRNIPLGDERIVQYVADSPIQARAEFARSIPLEYELQYNPNLNRFITVDSIDQDLLVLDIQSDVEYLDQERAKITFGASLDFNRALSLASIAEEFGQYGGAIENSFLGPVRDVLEYASEVVQGDITLKVRPKDKEYYKTYLPFVIEALRQKMPRDPADLPGYISSPVFENDVDQIVGDLIARLDLVNTVNQWTQPVREEIANVLNELESTISILERDEILGLLDELMMANLERLGLEEELAWDERPPEVDRVRQDVGDALSGVVKPYHDEAKQVFDEAGRYLTNNFFLPQKIRQAEQEVRRTLKEAIVDYARENADRIPRLSSEQLSNWLVDALYDTLMYRELRITLSSKVLPVLAAITDVTQTILDALNDYVFDTIKNASEQIAGLIEGAVADIKNTLGFRGASLVGYAITTPVFVEQLHIDGSFTSASPLDMTFGAYLDIHQYRSSNGGEFCGGRLGDAEVIDIKIGATNVPLGWLGQGVNADVEFQLMLVDNELGGIGGGLRTKGVLDYQVLKLRQLAFRVSIGKIENYLAAGGEAELEGYELGGAFFFGTSCSLDPLRWVDANVADFIRADTLSGAFLSVDGKFPILDFGCVLRVKAEAAVALWYFGDSDSYGGRLSAGVSGKVACAVHAKGLLTLTAAKTGDDFIFQGNGWIAGGVGWCEESKWTTPRKVLKDSWCFACVAWLDLLYENGWSADYDTDCG